MLRCPNCFKSWIQCRCTDEAVFKGLEDRAVGLGDYMFGILRAVGYIKSRKDRVRDADPRRVPNLLDLIRQVYLSEAD